MNNKFIVWGIGIVGVIAVLALIVAVGGNSQSNGGTFGAFGTRFPHGIAVGSGATVGTDGTFTVGTSGSNVSFVKATTCDLVGGAVLATTSVAADCAVTGVVAGDLVFTNLATSSALAYIYGARASSTAGYITVKLFNMTGGTSDVSKFGSSTAVLVFRATN